MTFAYDWLMSKSGRGILWITCFLKLGPFSNDVIRKPFLDKFKMPTPTHYNRTIDPADHVEGFSLGI